MQLSSMPNARHKMCVKSPPRPYYNIYLIRVVFITRVINLSSITRVMVNQKLSVGTTFDIIPALTLQWPGYRDLSLCIVNYKYKCFRGVILLLLLVWLCYFKDEQSYLIHFWHNAKTNSKMLHSYLLHSWLTVKTF